MPPEEEGCAKFVGGSAALRVCCDLIPYLREPLRLSERQGEAFGNLIRTLAESSLLPLCNRAFLAAGGSFSPAEAAMWRGAVAKQIAKSEMVWASVRDALATLQEAGLRPTLLKGAHTGAAYYPERALRPMADLDIHLEKTEAQRAWDLLRAAGYAVFGAEGGEAGLHLPPIAHPRTGTPVEIHSAVLYPRDDRRWERASVLLEGRLDLDVCGVPVRGLCPEPNIVYTLAHLLSQHAHVPAHAVGLCDVEAIVLSTGERLDWDRVFWLASQAGQESVLAEGLLTARELLNLPMPAEVVSRLEAEGNFAGPGRRPISTDAGRMTDTIKDLWHTNTAAGAARKLVGGLLPSPSELRRRERVVGGGPPLPALYFKRFARQLRQLAMLVKEKLQGGA